MLYYSMLSVFLLNRRCFVVAPRREWVWEGGWFRVGRPILGCSDHHFHSIFVMLLDLRRRSKWFILLKKFFPLQLLISFFNQGAALSAYTIRKSIDIRLVFENHWVSDLQRPWAHWRLIATFCLALWGLIYGKDSAVVRGKFQLFQFFLLSLLISTQIIACWYRPIFDPKQNLHYSFFQNFGLWWGGINFFGDD